jgi:hypothetical protein
MTKAPFSLQMRRTQDKWTRREKTHSDFLDMLAEQEEKEEASSPLSAAMPSPLLSLTSSRKILSISDASGLQKILDGIKHHMGSEDAILKRTQAYIRGTIERTHVMLGLGGTFKQKLNRLAFRMGLVLTRVVDGALVSYPIVVKVRPSWMGMVRLISVFDVTTNRTGFLKLSIPFAPMKDFRKRRDLRLVLECQKVRTSWDLETVEGPRDGAETQSDSLETSDGPQALTEYTFLVIKFIIDEKDSYYRRVLLKYEPPSRSHLPSQSEKKANNTLVRLVEIFNEGKLNELLEYSKRVLLPSSTYRSFESITSGSRMTRSLQSGGDEEGSSIISSIMDHKSALEVDSRTDLVVIRTSLFRVLILREVFQWRSQFYLVQVLNRHDVTQVSFFHFHTNRLYSFFLFREFVDRSQKLKNHWKNFFKLLESHAKLRTLVKHAGLTHPIPTSSTQPMEPEESDAPYPSIPLSSGDSSDQEFSFAFQHLTCYAKLLARDGGASIILINNNHRPILGSSFEAYEAPPAANKSEMNRDEKSFNALLNPVAEGEASYQDDLASAASYQDAFSEETADLEPLTAFSNEKVAELIAEPDAFPLANGSLAESVSQSSQVFELPSIISDSRAIPSLQQPGDVPPIVLKSSLSSRQDRDMSELRVGGVFDNEDSLTVEENKEPKTVRFLVDSASLESDNLTGWLGALQEAEERKRKAREEEEVAALASRLREEENERRHREEERKRQLEIWLMREEEEFQVRLVEQRRIAEEARIRREEEERRRREEETLRRQLIQSLSRDSVASMLHTAQMNIVSQEITALLIDNTVELLVNRAIEERVRLKNAKMLTFSTLSTSVAVERLLTETTADLIDTIVNEEISWDILLGVFFFYFIHSLVREVVSLAQEDVEQEIEEQLERDEMLEKQRQELRKKAYYPAKVRSTVNESSHFLLNRKDPSLVPVNAWTEEFSVFSTVSPTRPTRTMSAARHRDQARAVVFMTSSAAQAAPQTALLPRPKTSSTVRNLKAESIATPEQLVRALRSASEDFDVSVPQHVDRRGEVHKAAAASYAPHLPEALLLELDTVAAYDPSRTQLSASRRPTTGQQRRGRPRSPESQGLRSVASRPEEKNARPATAPLSVCKDKEALYQESLKQIHRLGFAPSHASHCLVDLADGQPLRRPWEYTKYWQNLLSAFVRYHANLPSVKISSQPVQKMPSVGESLEEMASLSSAYGFDDKEAFEVFRDRPPFWLLKKQLTILQRAIRPEKFHSIRIRNGFSHLPKYELIKNRERSPTVEQLVCCLAECRGSVGEVIEKVFDLEFMKEIELVCDAINVKALICAVPDAECLFQGPAAVSAAASQGESVKNALSQASQVSQPIEWKDSSQVLESIIHRRNEEVKLYNRTKRRDTVMIAEEQQPTNPRRSKVIRRNSALCLTDFESDETFVVALKKVLAMNEQMSNVQRSIAEPPKETSRSSIGTSSHIPTGMMLLPRVGGVQRGGGSFSATTSLDSSSVILRSRASFVNVQPSRSHSQKWTNPLVDLAALPADDREQRPSSRASFHARSVRGSFLRSSQGADGPMATQRASFVHKVRASAQFAPSSERSVEDFSMREDSMAEDGGQPEDHSLVIGFPENSTELPGLESGRKPFSARQKRMTSFSQAEDPAASEQPAPPTRKRSYHFEKFLIEEAFREDVPNNGMSNLSILTRRDAQKLEQEETLLKSNKLYIREPIERKIELLTKMTPSVKRIGGSFSDKVVS